MREIGEIIFDGIYLCGVLTLGMTMIRKALKERFVSLASRPPVSLALADNCRQLCHVYSCRSLVSQHSRYRTADDS